MEVLTKREKEIITLLINSSNAQTGDTISTILHVSTRTVRNDVKKINSILHNHGAKIVSFRSKGYVLEVRDSLKFEDFKVSSFSLGTNTILYSVIEKLLILTYTDKTLYQQNLAEDLYISLSTLKGILPQVNSVLNKLHLELKTDKINGIMIDGAEERIRSGIYEYVFNGYIDPYQKYNDLFSINEMINIKNKLQNIFTKQSIKLTDESIRSLFVHIIITMSRLRYDLETKYSVPEISAIKNTEEYFVAKKIIDALNKEFMMSMDSEIYYITKHIIISGKLDVSNIKNTDFDFALITDIIIKSVKSRTSIDLSDDEEFKTGLVIHLSVAFNRIKFQTVIQNEFLDTIKSDYPLAFELAIIASEEIRKLVNLDVTENEIGYIAIHFGAALERLKLDNEKTIQRIIVLCGSGIATSTLIKKRLKSILGNQLVDIQTMSHSQFDVSLIEHTDLILSTMPLDIVSHKIKRISPVLSNQDLNKIKKILDADLLETKSDINNFFTKELFLKNVKKDTKTEVLQFVTDLMKKYKYIDKDTQKSIFERENIASTELGRLIAIPHPLKNTVEKAVVAVCILDKPIIWDEEMVQVILVLSIPDKDIDIWESVFRKIYEFLYEDFGISSLISDYEFEDLIKSLEHDRRRL